MATINFFQEDVKFKLEDKASIRKWITSTARSEGFEVVSLNFIYCSDEYLLKINQEYLEHNTYTDIITFDNSSEQSRIESDIFISVDRLQDNAQRLKVPFKNELHRVMIHGILHLVGYGDKTDPEKSLMREKEDAYLSLREF